MAENIFHLTTADAWERARQQGSYEASSLQKEGFMHCSRKAQVLASANRHFKNQRGLVLLEIDPGLLQARLVHEEGRPGELFPHIYGPLNPSAVVASWPFHANDNGDFTRLPF